MSFFFFPEMKHQQSQPNTRTHTHTLGENPSEAFDGLMLRI